MSKLNQLLCQSVARRYPSVSLPPSALFLPMLEQRKGEISSGAAIEIARVLRGSAPQIAAEIIGDVAGEVSGDWREVAGYIILNGGSSATVREHAPLIHELVHHLAESESERSIICLVPDATTPVYARLRLIARAALQAHLAVVFEGRCRLGFSPHETREVTSVDEVVALTQAAVEWALSHEGERRVDFEVPESLCRTEAPLTVWTSHHYHDRLAHGVKVSFLRLRNEGRAFIRIPSDGWLLSRDRVLADILSPKALGKLFQRISTQEGWLRWIAHFASSTNSGDLDPLVALYDECASPRWSLQALFQRVSSLLPQEASRDAFALRDLILSEPLAQREFSLKALFLASISARALREGEVGPWCVLVEEFAREGHALLNAPGYRAELKNMTNSPRLVQINASLALGCAAILPLITEG